MTRRTLPSHARAIVALFGALFVALVALPVPSGLPAAHAAPAGTGGIEGALVDIDTDQAVPAGAMAVAVTCGKVQRHAAVGAGGQFRFLGLPEGGCALTASGAAYVRVQLQLTVTAGAIVPLRLSVVTKASDERMRREEIATSRRHRAVMVGRGRGAAIDRMVRPEAMAAEPAPPMAALPAPAPPPPPAMAPPRQPAPRPDGKLEPKLKQRAPSAAPARGAEAVRGAKLLGALQEAKPVELDRPAKRIALGRDRRANIAAGRGGGAEAGAGWAVVRVFPVPQHTRAYDGPRTDFRETIYWNPVVETDAGGNAEVAFVTSDAVTSFRATAEGFSATGAAGGGQATFQSKLPLTLDARLPVEVTAGDVIRLPVTLANETDQPLDAALTARFGTALAPVDRPETGQLRLAPRSKHSVLFTLRVAATGTSDVELAATARGLTDQLARTIRVVPRGFPIELAASGTARGGSPARHVVDLAGALPGSIRARVTMYPSPVTAMTQGMAGMIREPGGCFEQTSSTNYPNIMILGYLGATSSAPSGDAGGVDPALIQKTQGMLERGYKLLTGYETRDRGYEWFGHSPGHEALTAYGLMEFADMAKVHDVDRKMVERTADWLMSRRDGKGGFQRSAQALDSFGRAGPATTNAYILWALAEAGRTAALGPELAAQQALGSQTADPYLLALAANTLLAGSPGGGAGAALARRLAGMQGKDGSFAGAKETITMSGGESLVIETTALAVLALLKASPDRAYEAQVRAGVDWLNSKRGGYGAWGNTQATVLGLKALTAYAEHARQMAAPGSATLIINGKPAGTLRFDKGRRDALVWDDLAGRLAPGRNTIELALDSQAALPYTVTLEYRSAQPASSPRRKVAVTTQLLKTQTRMGEGVTLRARIENTSDAGIPMTLARIGLPGGLVFQTWQLKELRDKGLIDFYETRPREVILYWRALPPSATKDVDLQLLASVPGTYEAPASSAYLYYTAEDKAWAPPVAITIDR